MGYMKEEFMRQQEELHQADSAGSSLEFAYVALEVSSHINTSIDSLAGLNKLTAEELEMVVAPLYQSLNILNSKS